MSQDNPVTTPHPAIARLPEWLRFHGQHNSCPDDHADCEWRSMLDAAANEIERLRAGLLVLSTADIGTGSFRAAAYDIAENGVTPETLRTRFAR